MTWLFQFQSQSLSKVGSLGQGHIFEQVRLVEKVQSEILLLVSVNLIVILFQSESIHQSPGRVTGIFIILESQSKIPHDISVHIQFLLYWIIHSQFQTPATQLIEKVFFQLTWLSCRFTGGSVSLIILAVSNQELFIYLIFQNFVAHEISLVIKTEIFSHKFGIDKLVGLLISHQSHKKELVILSSSVFVKIVFIQFVQFQVYP